MARRIANGVVLIGLAFVGACGDVAGVGTMAPSAPVVLAGISPTSGTTDYCQAIQLSADVHYSSGAAATVDSSRWTSSDSAVTVSASGMVHSHTTASPGVTVQLTVWVGKQTTTAQSLWVVQPDAVLFIGPDGKPVPHPPCPQGW